VPSGLPWLAEYEAWKKHPRSIPKMDAMEDAIDAWLASTGVQAP
jgi:hypothetical protein